MTVLVCQHKKEEIILAADSGVFWGNTGMKENNSTKIIEVKDNIVFASCGSVSEKSLFETYLLKHEPETNSRQGVLRMFIEFITWKKTFIEKAEQNNCYFFVYDKIPYKIDWGFDIETIPEGEFRTHGAGMQEAKCAMYLGKTPRQAVELTKELNCWASGETMVKIIKKEVIKSVVRKK